MRNSFTYGRDLFMNISWMVSQSKLNQDSVVLYFKKEEDAKECCHEMNQDCSNQYNPYHVKEVKEY